MSQNDFDRLGWVAGNDGASVSPWPSSVQDRPEDDYDDLMGAWLAERSRVVEAELLLARARDVLAKVLAAGISSSPATRREMRRLLGEIDDQID